MSTDESPDVDEAIDVVARRASVIECLLDGPSYNRDIRDELDISRSTAYKAATELEELGIARRGDDGHELTALGRLLYDEYCGFRERMSDICGVGGLLDVLPTDIEIPAAVVRDAEVHRSERHAPNRPVREIERLVDTAAVLNGTAPVVLPRYVELFSEQVRSGNLEASLVYERPVFDYLMSEYEEDLRMALKQDNLCGRVTEQELPYGLVVVEAPERRVAVIVYDTTGDIEGIIMNDTEAAYEWGEDRWTTHWATGRPVPQETGE